MSHWLMSCQITGFTFKRTNLDFCGVGVDLNWENVETAYPKRFIHVKWELQEQKRLGRGWYEKVNHI